MIGSTRREAATKKLATLILAVGTIVLGPAASEATDISGTIATTLTITENSQLVGDVACDVTDAPCIVFGAPNIVLLLNGFTMTGQGLRGSCPSLVAAEHGIRTLAYGGASIQGPGLVRRFRGAGIVLDGNSQLSHVVVASVCRDGIAVLGTGNEVVANTVVRAALSGGFNGGIVVRGSGGHSILRNEVVGASGLEEQGPCPSPAPCRGGHGIFVGSMGNLIQSNNASGNPGAGILVGIGATSNMIRRNAAVGNIIFHDIFDDNAAGANEYANNLCEVSGGSGAPACPKPPNIAGQ